MVGGAVPNEDGSELVLSTARLNRIRDLDPADMTLTIEAGVTLKAAQLAAAEQGCLLPLSISSEGTAQIGGVLAVNAGGNNTVRYGNARDLVLGLEVVLPDGSIWNGLRRLRKDNTGYCLRQIFVGSEGTLGIITAAVLKLAPQPKEVAVALCGVATPEAAMGLFTRFQAHDAASISAFELMSGLGMSFVLKHIPGAVMPVETPAEFYVLVELASPRPDAGLRAMLEAILERRWRTASSRTPPSPSRKRNGRQSGSCARNTPKRRSAKAPASRTTFLCRYRKCLHSSARPPLHASPCCPACGWSRSGTWETAIFISISNSRPVLTRHGFWRRTMPSWTR